MPYVESRFPVCGLDLTRPYCKQSPRPLPKATWDDTGEVQIVPGLGPAAVPADVWGRTCAAGVNVRGYEAAADRRRGGTRAGLAKHLGVPVVADWIIQDLNAVVGTGTAVQSSQSGRVEYLVAVCQGNVYYARAGDAAWSSPTNTTGDTPPLNFDGVMFAAANGQKLWFADGVNWVKYDPVADTVSRWAATAGTLPVDADNNTPRLIETWRGRTVLSGLLKSPQQVHFSAVDVPTDFDYAPGSFTPTQAVALTTGQQGLVGDVVTALIPATDDVMYIGGSHSIKVMVGDPADGGKLQLVTDAIGVAWGRAWCRDPYGTVYFVSNGVGVYSMAPGQMPTRISQPIESLVQAVNTGTNGIRMAWRDRDQTVHVYITLLDEPSPTTHYVYEARTGAWFQEVFANDDHNPLALCTVDGNGPGDRELVLGSWDGYVRKYDDDAADDDGTPISSRVLMGPIVSPDFQEMRLDELLADLSEGSGDVTYEVLVGTTAEKAATSTAVATGTLSASRNTAKLIRRAAHAVYVAISSTNKWALERLRLRISGTGMVRARRR